MDFRQTLMVAATQGGGVASASPASFVPQTPPAVQNIGYGNIAATFSTLPFDAGTALLFISLLDSTASIVTVTVGAASASLVKTSGITNIYQIDGLSAGNKTVVITASEVINVIALSYGALVTSNTVATSTGGKPQGVDANPQVLTAALTIPTNGIGLIVSGVARNNTTNTWSVGTEIYDITHATAPMSQSVASISATSTPAFTNSFGDFPGSSMAAAAWGP